MTELHHSAIANPIQPSYNHSSSVSTNDAPPVVESGGEDPYTIKCICDYSDDDGNTILCEICDTWQHIECFYPGQVEDASKEEFDHSCADCKPRDLDRRHATERQRQQRQNKLINENGDKKTKRPQSKSHKKKSKPSDVQVNGYHELDSNKNGSPHDHNTHMKKPKGHRSTQSMNSQLKRSPPFSRPHNHAHPPSPAHTPPDLPPSVEVHGISDSFRNLYQHDQDIQRTTNNSFASLLVSNAMLSWVKDEQKLREEVGVEDKHDVFQFLKVGVDTLSWPHLQVDRKDDMHDERPVQWRYLTTPSPTPSPGRIGELNGLVGFQKDYCSDVENRWQDSAHPRPFVFFHPRLPLYIDTRQEGSVCRYVRRSCRPNTTLETFIANGLNYHFWLTSERPLSASEQITIPWDFGFPAQYRSRYLHLLNLGDEEVTSFDNTNITDEEYDQLTQIIHLVLSDHGGCACDLGHDCAFARFHRNYYGRSQMQSNGVKSKKGRKPKQNHVSPTSTGHATNSRAASEGQQEQFEDDDNRSVSGSIRSKPHSRDMTPSNGISESNGVLTEPSDREKRKLAMLEDSFRKMEQGQGQPPRKKKRASDSSSMSLPVQPPSQPNSKPRQRSVAPRAPIIPVLNSNGARTSQYIDKSTSGRQSTSPSSAISLSNASPYPNNPQSRQESMSHRSRQGSANSKATYTDSFTQTENSENEWWNSPKPKAKRSIVPLAKRLLKNRRKLEEQQAEAEAQQERMSLGGSDEIPQVSPTASMDSMHNERFAPQSPVDFKDRNVSISSSTTSVDVASTSADVVMVDSPASVVSNSIKPPPPPWPGQKSPDLRVQMPPTPIFSSPNMSGGFPSSSPSSATSFAQSPLGTIQIQNSLLGLTPINNSVTQPSPLKKKLSLSEYNKMKKTSVPSLSKATPNHPGPTTTLKPSLSTVEEIKDEGIKDESASVDTPMADAMVEPSLSITSGHT